MIRLILHIILLMCSLPLVAQGIEEKCGSRDPFVAIPANEEVYAAAEREGDLEAMFLTSMSLARFSFMMCDHIQCRYWDAKAREAMKQAPREYHQENKALYKAFSNLWSKKPDLDRLTINDVYLLCTMQKNVLAFLFKHMPDKGIRYCDQIIRECHEAGNDTCLATFSAYANKATLLKMQKSTQAMEYYMKAFRIQQSIIRNDFPYLTENERMFIWHHNFDGAFSLLQQIVENGELENTSLMYEAYDQLLLSKGVLLTTTQKLRQGMLADPVLADSLRVLGELHRAMLFGEHATAETMTLRLKANSLERCLAGNADITALRDYQNITADRIRETLRDGEVAIEFAKVDSVYYALMLSKRFNGPIPCTAISEREIMQAREQGFEALSELIYRKLWDLVIKLTPDLKTVYFSPTELLHVIPIEHSLTPDGVPMSERYNMHRLTSTRNILTLPLDAPPVSTAQVFGVALPDLPFAVKEANSVGEILRKNRVGTVVVRGDMESPSYPSSVKALSGAAPDILHFATHVFWWDEKAAREHESVNFLPNEERGTLQYEDMLLSRSGLRFAGDSVLTSAEISQLNLSATRYVTLSACQTGLGEITSDGVFGLQRAFRKAGATTILMTLWSVPDRATMLFMQEYYSCLMRGRSPTQSLLEAQTFLRHFDDGRYNAPHFWAPFVAVDGCLPQTHKPWYLKIK